MTFQRNASTPLLKQDQLQFETTQGVQSESRQRVPLYGMYQKHVDGDLCTEVPMCNCDVSECSTASNAKGRHSKLPRNSNREVLPAVPEHITTNDTFQKLSYATKIPFNVLWPSKDIDNAYVAIPLCKGIPDDGTDNIIGGKIIEYVSPAVNLHKVDDSAMRKRIIEFMYTTTSLDAAKDTWQNMNTKRVSSPTKSHLRSTSYETVENEETTQMTRELQNLCSENPSRQFLRSTRSDVNQKDKLHKQASMESMNRIKDLIEKDKLSLIYDKLPLSYAGYRSELGIGVKLERKNLPVGHPDLTVSQVLTRRYEDDPSL